MNRQRLKTHSKDKRKMLLKTRRKGHIWPNGSDATGDSTSLTEGLLQVLAALPDPESCSLALWEAVGLVVRAQHLHRRLGLSFQLLALPWHSPRHSEWRESEFPYMA